MKQFYFCIDTKLSASQSEQHFWAQRFAEKMGGAVVFYGSEELKVVDVQPFVLPKLSRTPGLDGVIFFTFEQFCLGDKINLKLIRNILMLGISLNFVRENISFDNLSEVSEQFLVLSGYKQSTRSYSLGHTLLPDNS
jgi:hypothetical protein